MNQENPSQPKNKSTFLVDSTFKTVDEVVNRSTKEIDSYIEPVRRSVLKRFPVLFMLLVTFGVSMIFFSFEKIISQYQIFNQHPWLILLLGVGTLAFTGKLYKKLS